MATGTSANCPRESASGEFTAEFGTNNAGATAAMKWLQEKRAWIEDTFKDLCAHDTSCPKTNIVIKATSAIDPLTKDMAYTISFQVICYCTTEITPPRRKTR